jgi:hypothetical protein
MQSGKCNLADHLVLLHLYAALIDQPFQPSQATQWALSPFIHYSLLLMLRHKKSMPASKIGLPHDWLRLALQLSAIYGNRDGVYAQSSFFLHYERS